MFLNNAMPIFSIVSGHVEVLQVLGCSYILGALSIVAIACINIYALLHITYIAISYYTL